MNVEVTGRLWRLGDNIDTDRLFPSKYVTLSGASTMIFAFIRECREQWMATSPGWSNFTV